MPGQILELPIASGVDQHTDPRKLQPGKLISAYNAAMFKAGKLAKRYGTSTNPVTGYNSTGAANPAAPFLLAAHGNEQLLVERGRLFTRTEAKTTNAYVDQLSDFTVTQVQVSQHNGTNYDADVALDSTGALECYVWTANFDISGATSTSITVVIQDGADGSIVCGPTVLASGTALVSPKVIFLGTNFIVTWVDSFTNNVSAARCDTSVSAPLSWTAPTSLATDRYNATFAYDIRVNGSNFTLAYQNLNTGITANALNLRTFSQTLAAGVTNLNIPTGTTIAATAMSIDVAGTTLWWAAVYPANNTGFQTFTASTLAIVSGPKTTTASVLSLACSITDLGNGNAWIAWNELSAPQYLKGRAVSPSAAVGSFRVEAGKWLQCRPIVYSGKLYAVAATVVPDIVTGDPIQGTTVLLELPQAFDTATSNLVSRPVAVWEPRTTPELGNHYAHMANFLLAPSGKLRTVGSTTDQVLLGEDGGLTQRATVYGLAFDPDLTMRQSAQLGGLTYFTGGVPSFYDGAQVGEVSFIQYPHATIVKNAAAGGLGTGTYQYALIFKHWDAAGNVHRSAPYTVSVAIDAASHSSDLTIDYLYLTTRQDTANSFRKVVVEIYRTKVNDSVFRRLTSGNDVASGLTASSTSTMRNDPASYQFTYHDTAGDSTLNGQPILYTQTGASGAELENVNPPSSKLVTVHRGRVVYAGTPDGKTVWLSKKSIFGEAPGFSEGLTLYVDDGGSVTAIASLDDKLVVFKSDRIFVFTGDGPDATGQNSDWSDPIRINSPVGSVSPFVCVTPLGVVFRSAVGLSLLGRDLTVNPYFGQAVESDLATYTTTTGMLTHPTLPEIRIQAIDSGKTIGAEFRYDYRHDAWFVAQFRYDANTSVPVISSALLGSVPHYTTLNGSWFKEDTSTRLDNGSFVTQVVKFAPVATAGMQGYQEFRSLIVLGDRGSDHDLTITITYDDAGALDQKTIASATSAAWSSFQFELSPPSSNKCERFTVQLLDTFSSGNIGDGTSFSISGIAFDVEPKAGPNRRLPAAQRI